MSKTGHRLACLPAFSSFADMAFVKYRGDDLFDGYRLLGPENVLITDETGRVEAVVALADAGPDVQYRPGILHPGFVNAHCHLELSHLKGQIPEHTGMVNFLLAVVGLRVADPEVQEAAMRQAEAAMLADGIVAVGDICNTSASFSIKKEGRLQYHNFLEATGSVPAVAVSRYEITQQLLRLSPKPASIAPHAPYSISPPLFDLIFSQPQTVVSMHNQESAAENEFFKTAGGTMLKLYRQLNLDIAYFKATGKSSLQSVLPYFKNLGQMILVHNCLTDEEDLHAISTFSSRLSRNHLFTFCLCPNANLYIGNPLPDVGLLWKSGHNICLGTDSLSSNHQLSIKSEINTLRKHFPEIPLEVMLQWATLNGARALQMDDKLGSFEKGKRPGVGWYESNEPVTSFSKS
jgi:aminodeoxyfutalosine deaminase